MNNSSWGNGNNWGGDPDRQGQPQGQEPWQGGAYPPGQPGYQQQGYPGQQGYPYPQGYPGQPNEQDQKKSNTGVIVSVIAALVVLIGAGGAGLWFLTKDDSDADDSSDSVAFVPSESEDRDTGDDDTDAGRSGLEDRLLDEDTSSDDTGESSGLQSNLKYPGFENSDALCDGDDTWVYAGTGGGSDAVVCLDEADDNYYMRADFEIGTAQGPVDEDAWFDIDEGVYTVDVDGGTIEVLGGLIYFSDSDGDTETLAHFDTYYVSDGDDRWREGS